MRQRDVMPYAQLLFFEYDGPQPLRDPADARCGATGPDATTYDPQARIDRRPASALAGNLIYGRGGLADLWWP